MWSNTVERRFTKHTSDEFEGTEVTVLAETWFLGDVRYDIKRHTQKRIDGEREHLHFDFFIPYAGDEKSIWVEVNLDGKYHKFDGHNVELSESDDYWPGWGVYDKGQANLTSPLSLDQLKAICDAKEIVAAKSAADETEERVRVKFGAD
jgi:hypothetical protein